MGEKPNSGDVYGELVPQPHGGALRRGGKPGNRGGSGRPPDELRELMRKSFRAGLERACEMLQSRTLDPVELARLLDIVGKYAMAYDPPDAPGEEMQIRVVRFGEDDGRRS